MIKSKRKGLHTNKICPHRQPKHSRQYGRGDPDVDIEEFRCDNLGVIMGSPQSSYFDTMIFVLLHQKNTYLNSVILEVDLSILNIDSRLFEITQLIQTEMISIKVDIEFGQIVSSLRLRQLFQEYQNVYNLIGGTSGHDRQLPVIDWINGFNQPIDVITRLIIIFDCPNDVTIKRTIQVTHRLPINNDDLITVKQDLIEGSITTVIDAEQITKFTSRNPNGFDDRTDIHELGHLINKHKVTTITNPKHYMLAPDGKRYPYVLTSFKYVTAPLLHVHLPRLIFSRNQITPQIIKSDIYTRPNFLLEDQNILQMLVMIVYNKGKYYALINCNQIWYKYDNQQSNGVENVGDFDELFSYYPDDVLSLVTDYFYLQ
jgi:hypothetical protein